MGSVPSNVFTVVLGTLNTFDGTDSKVDRVKPKVRNTIFPLCSTYAFCGVIMCNYHPGVHVVEICFGNTPITSLDGYCDLSENGEPNFAAAHGYCMMHSQMHLHKLYGVQNIDTVTTLGYKEMRFMPVYRNKRLMINTNDERVSLQHG